MDNLIVDICYNSANICVYLCTLLSAAPYPCGVRKFIGTKPVYKSYLICQIFYWFPMCHNTQLPPCCRDKVCFNLWPQYTMINRWLMEFIDKPYWHEHKTSPEVKWL